MPPLKRRRRGRRDARVGQILDGRFQITRLVARGGMGKIYEAIQEPLGRRVALKVMDLGFAEDLDPDFQKRFFLEASTCAKLTHPNTIRVFDYGSTGGESDTFFIAMEFIDGATLLETIEEDAPLNPLRAIRIGRQICSSLREAHEMGLIHRDLKPSNVLLTTHGDQTDFVKVLDFGLVKLMQEDAEDMTKSGLFLGSPNYMSPEQIKADAIDQRSDIYSLGVLLYMGLTGVSPFKRESSVKVLLAQLEDPPEPFSEILPAGTVPAALEWVVMTCLQKDPSRRFATVSELSRALKACAAEIRGVIPSLEMRLEDGKLILPQSTDLFLQRSSLPSEITRGELETARRYGGIQRTVDGPGPAETSDTATSPAEPSLASAQYSTQADVPLPASKRGSPVTIAIVGALLAFVLVVALVSGLSGPATAPSSSQALESSDSANDVVPSEVAPSEVAPSQLIPSESPDSSARAAGPNSASDGEEPSRSTRGTSATSSPRSSKASKPRSGKKARKPGQRRSTRKSSLRRTEDRSVQVGVPPADPTKTDRPATSAGSEVESAPAKRSEVVPENDRAENDSPNEMKGDLRDPWGD